jgi:hypothetical protein
MVLNNRDVYLRIIVLKMEAAGLSETSVIPYMITCGELS